MEKVFNGDCKTVELFDKAINREDITGCPLLTDDVESIPKLTGGLVIEILLLGIPPPEKKKLSQCAVTETWLDPTKYEVRKAESKIRENLKQQFYTLLANKRNNRMYKKDQRMLRILVDCDPQTVYKTCDTVRRNVGKDMMMFYYNGHGATSCRSHTSVDGEQYLWVVKKEVMVYDPIPLSQLMEHVKTPALYIWDCDYAGHILNSFAHLARAKKTSWDGYYAEPMFEEHSMHLAACGADETLPQNPELPADLYTCCLTTTLRAALTYWFHQQKVTGFHIIDCIEYMDQIPGELNDIKTRKGELEWILVAVLDTLAWQMPLTVHEFYRLFRSCKPIASCFRGHILADRIMRSYNVRPLSVPELPSMANHPLWKSWDLALDSVMTELSSNKIRMSFPGLHRQISTFFFDQLAEFKSALEQQRDRVDCTKFPILLQMLIGYQFQGEALRIISSLLDRSPVIVEKLLNVGILPGIVYLMKTPQRGFNNLLALISAKVLAVDRRNATIEMLVRHPENRQFFLRTMNDPHMGLDTRALSCFCLSVLVRFSARNQEQLLNDHLIKELDDCLEELHDSGNYHDPGTVKLQNCAVLCLAHLWENNEQAVGMAARANTMENYVVKLLEHPNPETRTAAVYALGTFLSTQRSESQHGESMEHKIAKDLLLASRDGCVHVRKEAVVALSRYVLQYQHKFIVIAQNSAKEEGGDENQSTNGIRKHQTKSLKTANKFMDVWRCLEMLEADPDPSVQCLAARVTGHIEGEAQRRRNSTRSNSTESTINSIREVSEPLNIIYSDFNPKDKVNEDERPPSHGDSKLVEQIVSTEFIEWSDAAFSKPQLDDPADEEKHFLEFEMEKRHSENNRKAMANLQKRAHERLDTQIFGIKHECKPHRVGFHPYAPMIYIVDDRHCNLVEYEPKPKQYHRFKCSLGRGSTKDVILLNELKRPFLCVINSDAEVYIWRNFENPHRCSLASTFKASSEVNRRVGILMHYVEFSSTLLIFSQVKRIVSWNLNRETRSLDIQTHTEHPVTSFSSSPEDNLLVTGFQDGTCRLFDLRTPSHNQVVQKFGGHGRSSGCPVVKVHTKPNNDNRIIYVASQSGDISLWDLRQSKTDVVLKYAQQQNRRPPGLSHRSDLQVFSGNMRTVAFHNYAPVMACGSHDQGIKIWNTWGDKLNDIKFHEGFMGQKVGPSVSLQFHPFEYKLVSAGQDNCVTVYGKATDPVNKN